MADTIEYVIYVRKSTDDASWERQAQSIPDQIERCVNYAKDHGLDLKLKPDNFEFEDEKELKLEDSEKDLKSRRIYLDTRKYYIIKERMSGKFPWRPKRGKLIRKIRKWEIKWLLSYSPDRQARNMVDGWNLIDCVDCWQVDLKYTNFNFEPNAAWKMMLWMWFVFSKQYSDKLWEDVARWKKSSISKWHSQWEYKYWYYRDENKHFVPDWKNFDLMKEAFRMKVEDKASDKVIANRLNANWFAKNKKYWNKAVSAFSLWQVWIDPFYYWIYVNWVNQQNLREVEGLNFIPMISEEWHNILMDRYVTKKKQVAVKVSTESRKDEYAFSLPEWMLKTEDWYVLVPYITKKKHRLEMYEKAKKEEPNLKLEDFIKSSNVRYELKTNIARWKNPWVIAVNQDVLEEAIAKALEDLKMSEKDYKAYVNFMETKASDIRKQNQEKQSAINMRMWSLERERREYLKKFMWMDFREWEEEIYNETLKEFDDKKRLLERELNNITVSERKQTMEMDMITKVINKAAETYRKSTRVRKKKLCKILISNIYIDKKKRLTIKVNHWISKISVKKSSSTGKEGIEPPTAVPKTDVLPLHHSPIVSLISLVLF